MVLGGCGNRFNFLCNKTSIGNQTELGISEGHQFSTL